MDNIRERKSLFKEYLVELAPFEHIQPSEEDFREQWKDRSKRPFSRWYDIKAHGKTVGFVIIGWGDNCHPDADFYIQDVYIRPPFRHQGYIRKFMEKYFAKHKGVYCLLILNENRPAKLFWTKLFTKAGFQPCWLSDVGVTDQYCKQYGWR